MSDTESLNLIEHYKWAVQFDPDLNWTVCGEYGLAKGFTLREAISATLSAQAKWSLGN